MNLRFKPLVVFMLLCSMVACTTQSPEPGIASLGDEIPSEIRDAQLVGEPYVEPRYEQVSAVNCDGQSRHTRLERSLSQGQTTFFEVQVGIGGLVKGAIVPKALEAELEAKIQAAIGRVLSNTYQQRVQVEIETQPGTAYLHTVTWNETKVNGIIEVVYPSGMGRVGFEKIVGLELGDRTSEVLSCDSPEVESITSEPPTLPPTSTPAQAIPPTSIPSTPMPVSPRVFSSLDRVPGTGETTLTILVNSGEVHAITSGPICISGTGVCFPGGEHGQKRGSVVVLLPRDEPYLLTGLVPLNNWHGSYYAQTSHAQALAETLVNVMRENSSSNVNCDGGCNIVDVLIIGTDGVVASYTVQP